MEICMLKVRRKLLIAFNILCQQNKKEYNIRSRLVPGQKPGEGIPEFPARY
jgi:hypothetical protein